MGQLGQPGQPGQPHDELDRRLAISVALNVVIVVAEYVGGWLSGSLALLADATHNLSDVAALLLALVARRLGRRPPSLRHTFGLRRVEVLAALLNSATLLVVVTLIVREAIHRLQDPPSVAGPLMLGVALVGLAGNLISVMLLKAHAHGHDLNTRSAFLHLIQDTLSSVVVVIAAALAGFTFGPYLDPIASILVALAVVHSGYGLLKEALHILMEGTPRDVDIRAMVSGCQASTGIEDMHHVHVWETGGGVRMLTAHVTLDNRPLQEVEQILDELRTCLATRWGIAHATLEPEFTGCGSDAVIETAGHGPATTESPADSA